MILVAWQQLTAEGTIVEARPATAVDRIVAQMNQEDDHGDAV